MPTPGPRTQTGPDEGYRNPGLEQPDRFNLWDRPAALAFAGRSPGLMSITLRGCTLAAGTVRAYWRQSIDYIPAQAAFSWTENAPSPGRPVSQPTGGFEITRALRYMARSYYARGGADNTRFAGLHTVVPKITRAKPISVGRGQTRSRPTVRNRVSSFGGRVPTLNQPIDASDNG